MSDKLKLRAKNLLFKYYDNCIAGKISKDECYKAIILVKMIAIKNIEMDITIRKAVKFGKRRLATINTYYLNLPNIRMTIPKYHDALKNLKNERVFLGYMLETLLNQWELLGAKLDELLNLCNISKSVLKKGPLEDCEEFYNNGGSLFETLFIYYLDYKDVGFWIEDTPNAPFTTIVRGYMLEQMLSDPNGKKASKQALKECFPDFTFYQIVTAENGEKYLMSEDGTETLPII